MELCGPKGQRPGHRLKTNLCAIKVKSTNQPIIHMHSKSPLYNITTFITSPSLCSLLCLVKPPHSFSITLVVSENQYTTTLGLQPLGTLEDSYNLLTKHNTSTAKFKKNRKYIQPKKNYDGQTDHSTSLLLCSTAIWHFD